MFKNLPGDLIETHNGMFCVYERITIHPKSIFIINTISETFIECADGERCVGIVVAEPELGSGIVYVVFHHHWLVENEEHRQETRET